MSLHQSKKGIILFSMMTKKFYLVTKWKDYGNGNIEALTKEEISADKVTKDDHGKWKKKRKI